MLAWVCRKIVPFWYHCGMKFLTGRGWAAAAALAVLALAAVRFEHDRQYRMLHTGDRLVPLRVASINGAPFTLRSDGRPMVINVFATWCGPCRAEAPGLAQAARRLRARGIDVVGIDQQEGGAQVRQFARDFSVPYPLYVDSVGITHTVLGARMIPTTLYVDASGVIRWEHAGPISTEELLDET